MGQLSNMLLKSDGATYKGEGFREPNLQKRSLEGFYEELSVIKAVPLDNSVTVSLRRCPETAKNLVYIETDLSGEVVVHWGVSRGEGKKWEIPPEPYPAETLVFKNKALRTPLQVYIKTTTLL